MNEILWFGMLFLNFGAILIVYRVWGKLGLFIWIPIAAIIANIQVIKTIEIFGMTATLGNIVYAGSFLVTDILNENYDRATAKKAIGIGFAAIFSMTVLMQLALLFVPSAEDFSQDALRSIFSLMPRITLASFIAYFVSQYHDIWAYDFWKRKKPGLKFLWLRNNASTLISQLIDSLLFTVIAFWGIFPAEILLQILVTTYILKAIVAVIDTPFLYLARKLKNSVD